MEKKCFYCPASNVTLATVSSYVVAGGKTYPVCSACDEVVGSIAIEDYDD
jgi:hypothetical protein